MQSSQSDRGHSDGTDDDDGLFAGLPRGHARKSKAIGSRDASPGTADSSQSEQSASPTYLVHFRDGVPATSWFIDELPRYPSWSIHALGKYFSYSHSSGQFHDWFISPVG